MNSVFKPVKKKSLATAVFEQLRDRILHGDIRPGDNLPSERILVERLQVNRGAVREGLKRLEQAGLVSITQGGATSVLDFKKTAGLEILGAMIVGSGGNINTAIARSVIEMRTTLAGQLVNAAAKQTNPDQIETLYAIVDKMKANGDNLELLQQLAMDFWGGVVAHSKSLPHQLAYNSLNAVYSQIQQHLTHILAEELQAIGDYKALVKALEANHQKKATNAAKRILERGANAIESILGELDAVQ